MKEKVTVSMPFMMISILFCVCLIASNILETKVFHVWGPINLTGGFIVFPISYIINDCIAEVWGYRKARIIIWAGFMMNFFFMAVATIACFLPPLEPGADASFRDIFFFAPQITLASFIAFLVGSFLNAWVMSKMKLADREKGHFNIHFAIRAIWSTIVGESADSITFFPLAFYIFPLLFSGKPAVSFDVLIGLMITQVVAKTLYEVFVLPVTIRVVKGLKRIEGIDVYDDNVSYNVFGVRDLS